MTTVERHIIGALEAAEDIRWLRGYLRGLLDADVSWDVLERSLKRGYDAAQTAGDERVADLMLDGLDMLTGWCGPGMDLSDRRTA